MTILNYIKNYIGKNKLIEELIIFFVVFVISFAIYLLLKKIIRIIIHKTLLKSKNKWIATLRKRKFSARILLLIPGIIIYITANDFTEIQEAVQKLSLIYIFSVIIFFINAFVNTVNDIYETYKISDEKPIKGYLQTFMIVIYLIGFTISISILLNVSPIYFLSSLGAMAAILVVIFRNTILSFVAGIHLTTQQLIKKGDWITMAQYQADGDVIDIALHTIKVQNFDKTVVSIPTYKFLEESFQNWRGMKEAGGRRIKRSFFVDITSVRFLTANEIKRFRKIVYLEDYLKNKIKELDNYNKENKLDLKDKISGRRLTNLGIFRNYILNYLEKHPRINHDLKLMVRHLEPGENGLPLQIYAFTNETDWKIYESIQSDIFEHIISIIPEFGLRIFQQPTGMDFHFTKK